jgi:hypothetical protein
MYFTHIYVNILPNNEFLKYLNEYKIADRCK